MVQFLFNDKKIAKVIHNIFEYSFYENKILTLDNNNKEKSSRAKLTSLLELSNVKNSYSKIF